jgi:hypothetical protein
VEVSLVGPWCMNLRSVGWCSFVSLALLVGVEVGVGRRWVLVLPIGSGDCFRVFVFAVLVSVGARLVGDFGATEMHSRRSW